MFLLRVLLLSSLLLSGCRPEFTKTRDRTPVPEEYRLNKATTASTLDFSLLDTNAVYINESVWGDYSEDQFEQRLIYWPIRFSNNGIGVRGPTQENFPTDTQLNNLSDGTYFFYTIDEGKLKIEWYDSWLPEFVYWYGTIDEDKIYFHKQKVRGFLGGKRKFDAEHFTYYRHPFTFDAPLKWPE